jgi:hypothetical protein
MSEPKEMDNNYDAEDTDAPHEQDAVLQEGLDYYFENGLMVLTASFLARRGYCCERGCRHCPYGYTKQPQ